MQASQILTQLILWATSSTNGAFTWHVSVIHILSCLHMDSFTSQTNTNWFAITLLSQYPVYHPSLPLGPYIPSSTDLFDSGLKSSWRIPGPLGERRLSCLLDVLCSGYFFGHIRDFLSATLQGTSPYYPLEEGIPLPHRLVQMPGDPWQDYHFTLFGEVLCGKFFTKITWTWRYSVLVARCRGRQDEGSPPHVEIFDG